ncbi:uncharacterized protein Dana_GF13012 [Drosophila ananassae]|uniref:Secreted protein n=1 Tax=Drosophila ananassae TaxID=7217 RepID=B3MED1_DROAN|nr:uncharacterized protein Dana_GF13012 [Drosophila ananassae]
MRLTLLALIGILCLAYVYGLEESGTPGGEQVIALHDEGLGVTSPYEQTRVARRAQHGSIGGGGGGGGEIHWGAH